ncbi:ESX secretion-associated protein EspG [Nocardia sp. alder85J]|uniref:ESX secretion-associated protein EspG n=1 Tax=Nocardia sp. alder85J TaxID=2862949 RepID=UPI001CD62323|nr:ESX secretion-associated protein EspG [Nocardia sp. alder85J]MCX4092197.1 ESX secretion-associated protein EspG [Nocardia sp. alder85J]
MQSQPAPSTSDRRGRTAPAEPDSGEDVDTDPVAIELNVDAALLLQDMVGIDGYPAVLAILSNVLLLDDPDRVRTAVAERLTEVGVLVAGGAHPAVAHWLRCLDRPDVEMSALVLDPGPDGELRGMLRMSLVRAGDTHVLALRCDDQIVIQPVFESQERLETVTAALAAALGPWPAVQFEPVRATDRQFAEVPPDPVERHLALVELGAVAHTASVLTRAMDAMVRKAEVVVNEHRDGGTMEATVGLSVLDTESGRIVVTPSVALDGELWSTYAPGDDITLHSGVAALVDLLPGRSWFGTRRTE